MYWFDSQRHRQPHFHARYAGKEAVFDLKGNKLEGNIGPRAERLVAEWAMERGYKLAAAWACAAQGKEIPWIAPLQ